ncbi:MAG: DUF1573 domain-containing protein [Saprospiraceae bacterium]
MKAGERWDDEIKQRLMDSEVVILLLSTDFFNSKYIVETELPKVVEKHKMGDCQIIPVIARVCHWKDTPFGEYAELGDIQALPVREKPIMSKGHWDNEDEPYYEVVKGIIDAIAKRRKKEPKPISIPSPPTSIKFRRYPMYALVIFAVLILGWCGWQKFGRVSESQLSGSLAADTTDKFRKGESETISDNKLGQPSSSEMPKTTIAFESLGYHFGAVKQGEVVKHIFKFKNTGDKPLLISNARSDFVGMGVAWAGNSIPPGGTGEIKVEWDTKRWPGAQSKRVTIIANTNPVETHLEIFGEVKKLH